MATPRPDTRRQPPKLPPQMRPFDDLEDLAASRMPAKPNIERPMGATAPPKSIESTSARRDAERRQADQAAQAAQAEAAGQGGGVQYTGGKKDDQAARDKYMEAGLAAKGDGLDELARARQAAAQEIDAQNARAAMDQRSRAGLGGLGLSGAASMAEGDLARQQARSKVLTMQQFDQAAADQNFTDIQRQAALDDLEDAAGIDYNNDGLIAGQTGAERKKESIAEKQKEKEANLAKIYDKFPKGLTGGTKSMDGTWFFQVQRPGTSGIAASDYDRYYMTEDEYRAYQKAEG